MKRLESLISKMNESKMINTSNILDSFKDNLKKVEQSILDPVYPYSIIRTNISMNKNTQRILLNLIKENKSHLKNLLLALNQYEKMIKKGSIKD